MDKRLLFDYPSIEDEVASFRAEKRRKILARERKCQVKRKHNRNNHKDSGRFKP